MKFRKKTKQNWVKFSLFLVIFLVIVNVMVGFNMNLTFIQAQAKTAAKSDLTLVKMGPTFTQAGVGFQVQKDGRSALWIKGENITKNTIIVWQKNQLATTYVDSKTLTACIPQSLYAKPGKYDIYLLDTKTKKASNKLVFTVEKKVSLKLIQMGPTTTKVNEGFQVQKNGESAIWVKGQGFTQNTKIVWGKTILKTYLSNKTTLTAIVPKSLYAKPGQYSIYLVDVVSKSKSNRFTFIVY